MVDRESVLKKSFTLWEITFLLLLMAASNTEKEGEREDRERRGGKNRGFFMVNSVYMLKHRMDLLQAQSLC